MGGHGRGRRRTARAARRRRRHRRRRRRVDPSRRRIGSTPTTRPRGWCRSIRRWSRAACRVGRHHPRRRSPAAAIEAGAAVVNDVSGGLADPRMAAVVARGRVPVDPDALARAQRDVMHDLAQLRRRGRATCGAELRRPGRRGARAPASTTALLVRSRAWASPRPPSTTGRCWRALDALGRARAPGADRRLAQAFLGALLADADGAPRRPDGREDATAAVTALAAQRRRVGRAGARRRGRRWTRCAVAAAWHWGASRARADS